MKYHYFAFRRVAGLFSLIFLLSLLTTACGTTPSPTVAVTTAAVSAEPVTITVWSKEAHLGTAMTDAIARFNKANKSVQINYVLKGDEMEDKINLAFAAKDAPDLYTQVGSVAKQVGQGYIMDLDGKLKKELLDVYRPYLRVGPHVVNGKVYSMPMGLTTIRLVYNKDLFRKAGLDPEKPPTTFSELKMAAKKITESSKGEAYGFGLPLNWPGYNQWVVEPLLVATTPGLARGGLFNFKEGHPQAMAYKPAIEMYRELVAAQSVYPNPGTLDNDQLRQAFAQGKIGMFMGASWDIAQLNTNLKITADWGAANVPIEDGKTLQQIPALVGGVQWSMWAGTRHPTEAATVMEFLLGAEMSQTLQKGGYINALHPAARSAEYLPQIKGAKDFAPTDKDIADRPSITSLIKLEGKNQDEVIKRLILIDVEPIDEALQDLNNRQQSAYNIAVSSGQLKPEVYNIGK